MTRLQPHISRSPHNVGLDPESGSITATHYLASWAMCGRLRVGKENLHVAGLGRCSHVWTAPSWQGESSRRRLGSMQPCVRPLRAVHMAAGHNALRGSGPGQKPAFENAVAHVGCPDRRIDQLCITCCSPSQPSHHAMIRGAISSDPQRGWIIVSLAPSHHGPGHSGELVG